MLAVGALGITMAAVFAVLLIRSGIREWRHDGAHQVISRRFGVLVDEKLAAGYDRSALIIGLGFAFVAVMMIDVLVSNLKDPVEVESLIFMIATAGFIACAASSFVIIGFNRPKFLVPPCHRGEMGAFASGRRPTGRRTR